jgi:hypothetical protein
VNQPQEHWAVTQARNECRVAIERLQTAERSCVCTDAWLHYLADISRAAVYRLERMTGGSP